MDKASFKSPDGDSHIVYNSNIWRNFRNSAGLTSSRKGTVSEAISTLYPVYIPVPSQVGSNTLARYYEQNKKNIFKSDKTYFSAIDKVQREAAMMKYLRLRTEMRNPPLDFNGNILPPRNFKKYPPYSKPNILSSAIKSDDGINYPHLNNTVQDLNITGPNRKQFLPTKLIFRENHPDFDKVKMEQQIKGLYRTGTNNSIKSKNANIKSATTNAV